MDLLSENLAALTADIAQAVSASGSLRAASDQEIVDVLIAASCTQRVLDAVLIGAVGEVAGRSENGVREDRLTSRFGCHDVSELVQRTTRVAAASAARLQKAAKAVATPVSLLTGEPLEPQLPALREALHDGVVGIDGVLAISTPLQAMGTRVARENLLTADAVLAAQARGEGPDGAEPLCADLLRLHAQVWSTVLDQDGAEPREQRAMHRRGVTLGAATDAGVPIRGTLMPEVAAQLQRIFDTLLSPRTDGVRFTGSERDPGLDSDAEPAASACAPAGGPPDTRTRPQKQHDALANALTVAASSGLLPTIGGAAPTLIVSVRAEDLATGSGYAHIDGCNTPVALSTATHTACAGSIQRIALSESGRILQIGTEERVFNRHQRRAITLRDGGCIIPGCGIPASWCEIHHVIEHAVGGPTHTDNGVPWEAKRTYVCETEGAGHGCEAEDGAGGESAGGVVCADQQRSGRVGEGRGQAGERLPRPRCRARVAGGAGVPGERYVGV